MTPKQKVRVHIQIERENKRKLNEWKEGKAMKIEFSNREYERVHGTAPKGWGMWWFHWNLGGQRIEKTFTGTLTEAKKQCRDDIKRMNLYYNEQGTVTAYTMA